MQDTETTSESTNTPMAPSGRGPAWMMWTLIAGVLLTVSVLYVASIMPREPAAITPNGIVDPRSELPEFTLTEASGTEMKSSALRGRVWIADFIFTHCAGPCPLMTRKMHKLQSDLADVADLRLVSFSVDPDRDTPSVLREYGERVGADPSRWLFLTGEMDDIYDLAIDGFKITVQEAKISRQIIHDTRFILVDRKGRIRGYYDSDDPADMKALLVRARELAG